MKCAQGLWHFSVITNAVVIQQRALPNYPGIQFSSNRKLSITVFSDLHFGERKSLHLLAFVTSSYLTYYSFICAKSPLCRSQDHGSYELCIGQ